MQMLCIKFEAPEMYSNASKNSNLKFIYYEQNRFILFHLNDSKSYTNCQIHDRKLVNVFPTCHAKSATNIEL